MTKDSVVNWRSILLDSGYFISNQSRQLLSYLGFCFVIGASFSLLFSFSILWEVDPSLEVLIAILRFLVSILLQCGLLVFIDTISQQQRISPLRAVMTAAPKLLTYIVAEFLAGLTVLVGLMMFIVPGVFLYSRLLLADFLIVLGGENNPLAALRGSFRRTAGNTGGLIVVVLLCILPVFVISWLGVLHQLANPGLLVRLLWMLVSWMLIIFWTLVRYRCYLLLREEKV